MRRPTLFIVLFVLCAANRAAACWLFTRDSCYVSENGRHKVAVTVADRKKGTPSQIAVFDRHGDEWVHSRMVPAVNSVRAAHVYLDNTGSCVVTVGNWYGKDFWTRAGDSSIVNTPEVEIRKGALTNAAISFERNSECR